MTYDIFDPTPGYHGNQGNTIRMAYKALQAGVPFKDHMLVLYDSRLARWGFTPEDLEAKGIDGDMVEQTAKLGVIVDLLWAAMLNAAALGQVERWETLERNYSNRVKQSLQAMTTLIDRIGQANTKTIDYQDYLEAQQAADD